MALLFCHLTACKWKSETPRNVLVDPNHRVSCFSVLRSSFGELALLYTAPRAATVKATSRCAAWVMRRAVYNTLKRDLSKQATSDRGNLLLSMPLIAQLSAGHRALLADALEMVSSRICGYVVILSALVLDTWL